MPLIGVKTTKSKSAEVKALSESAMRHNNAVIEYCRTSCCVLFGCLAGILGLTGIPGFAFYLCCLVTLWCSILIKTGYRWDKYFVNKFHLLTNGMFGGLFTYILFWTFLYGMIHKNYTYEELKRITKYGAVLSVSGVFATYLVWQYRLKQAEYTQEAFKLVTQNRPLVEMIGSFRTGMISLSKRQTFLDKNTAKMKVFLKGTNANGMLYFEATRDQTDNHWKVYKCEFEFLDAAGGRVRLIKEPEKREISDKSAAADTVKNSES